MAARITKKQAGVIYRNFKLGNIQATADEMSMMYDFVDGRCSAWSAEKMYYALKNCIDFILEGNFDSANVSFRNFVNA